ncbi:hypothetical protein ADEAN_000695400 [Angomonas deanei]|uniref:Dynein regulatory complex protein 10 n=1 Tax=Angomonas deanei TaxID=59799 RepID=A0A7G2CJ60_9TRYP|nr:hypothetical protein ADEAN_000695400 [Angomonas deanei]
MDIDPVTRREAEKVESVLADLIDDLELISLLPEEFNLWLRDDLVPQLNRLQESGGLDPQEGESLEEVEERHRYLQASAFVQAASCFGDPQDSVGNEAIVQVSDFSQLERSLLESATTVGHVDPNDLSFHRLSLRALLDTLRSGGYADCLRGYLNQYYPEEEDVNASDNTSQMDMIEAEGSEAHLPPPAKAFDANYLPYNPSAAAQEGIMDGGVNQLRQTVYTLLKLMQARNATTVNEDIKRYKILHETVNKELSTTADVQALNRDYEEVKKQRRREVNILDDAIAHLEEEFDYVKKAADVELGALESATNKVQTDRETAYKQQLAQHRSALNALEDKLAKVQTEHAEEISKLRSQRAKREQAVQAAITEHDERIESLTTQTNKLQKESEEDTAVIVQLEEQLSKLKKEEKEFNIERQIEQQRQDHLEQMQVEREQAARVVQAYYRAHAARQAFVLEQEKLNAKSKKKKGGKKKK